MSPKHDGNVKWPHFITSIIGIIVIIITYGISRAEFTQFEKRIDEKLTMVIEGIKELKR